MNKKTVLLIDDDQWFLEPLSDALEHEGLRVLKARTGEDALRILEQEPVDLVTIDIMLDPGDSLGTVPSHSTGLFLCDYIHKKYPGINAFCISVISDKATIRKIEDLGIRFLRKGEVPLRTVLETLSSRLR